MHTPALLKQVFLSSFNSDTAMLSGQWQWYPTIVVWHQKRPEYRVWNIGCYEVEVCDTVGTSACLYARSNYFHYDVIKYLSYNQWFIQES